MGESVVLAHVCSIVYLKWITHKSNRITDPNPGQGLWIKLGPGWTEIDCLLRYTAGGAKTWSTIIAKCRDESCLRGEPPDQASPDAPSVLPHLQDMLLHEGSTVAPLLMNRIC